MLPVSLYVGSVLMVNWLFAVVPMVRLPWNDEWSVGTLVVGCTFILRDYAQQKVGHRVIFATLVGAGLSFFLASPAVAMASAAAFLVSEMCDWGVFSVLRNAPFAKRILWSQLVGAPVDTAIFLGGIGALTPTSFLVGVLSKLAALVWLLRRAAVVAAVMLVVPTAQALEFHGWFRPQYQTADFSKVRLEGFTILQQDRYWLTGYGWADMEAWSRTANYLAQGTVGVNISRFAVFAQVERVQLAPSGVVRAGVEVRW